MEVSADYAPVDFVAGEVGATSPLAFCPNGPPQKLKPGLLEGLEFALDGGVRLNVSSPLRGAAKDGVFQARRAFGDDKILFRGKIAVKSKEPSKSQPPALQEVKTCLARAALVTGG